VAGLLSSGTSTPKPSRVRSLFGALVSLVILCGGLSLWGLGLSRTDPNRLSRFGLAASLDHWYFAGLAVLVVGFAWELSRRRRRMVILVLYVAAAIAVIHATIPLLYPAPEYSWAYKHIGVAEYFNQVGRITDPLDIYQNWPVFFAAVANVSALVGLHVLDFAAWAPVFFEAVSCLVVLAIFRVLSDDGRVAVLATMLFEIYISWIGQDYLSPQAFAYVLCFGVLLIAIRWLTPPEPAERKPTKPGRLRGAVASTRSWLRAGREAPPEVSRRARVFAVFAIVVIYAAIVAAHQLTPYVLLFDLVALAVFGFLRPRWLVLVMAAIAGGYLIPHYHLIAAEYGGIFSSFNLIQNAQGAAPGARGNAQYLSATTAHVLALLMWVPAALVIIANVKRPGRVLRVALLAFAPFAVLVTQRYGGEAIYRVYLFSAPWCAYLVADAFFRLKMRLAPRLLAALVMVGVTAALGVEALYGPFAYTVITTGDVAAANYFYSHAPKGATLVEADYNFPSLLTANSNDYHVEVLPADPLIGQVTLKASDIFRVTRYASVFPGPQYLVISTSMLNYAKYYSYPSGLLTLERELPQSLNWILVYRNADAVIYQLVP